VRSLARSPGFTIPAVLILAVGMTAATATFTLVDSIVFRPLDLPDSDRLVVVCEDHVRLAGLCIGSPANAADMSRDVTTLSELGYGRGWPYSITDGDESQGVQGGIATGGYLRALRAEVVVGRLFSDGEFGPDDDKVVLLSHAFWVARFGADPSVVGTILRLSDVPHEVVGVLGPEFESPFNLTGVQVWKPPHFDPMDPEVRGWRGFRVVGRLAEGSSVEAASAELTSLYAGLDERYDEIDDAWRLRVESLLHEVVGDTRLVLFAFLGGAGILLLIVCANVANLLLARGLARRDEFAVRTALGAGRGRLVSEILVECGVLAGSASVLALVMAASTTRLIVRSAPPGIPRLDEVSMDGRILAFSTALAVLVTVAFAVLPALRLSASDLGHIAKGGGTRAARRLQNTLVVTEVALCVVLLSSAAVLSRSFMEYLDWDPGFEHESLLAVSSFVDIGRYSTRGELRTFYERVDQSLEATPGVISASSASAGPLFGGGDGATSFIQEGADGAGDPGSVRWFDVGPDFFETLGIPIVKGRVFTEDDGPGSSLLAVVNEALVRAAWPDGEAIGKTLILPELDRSFEVVGVVRDVPPLTPGEATYPEIYWSNRQIMRPATWFVARVSGDHSQALPAIVEAIKAVDPTATVRRPRALTEAEDRLLVRPRFQAAILLALAIAALMLAAVGVYAVMSYAVTSRTRELGIRMALGAPRNSIIGLVGRSSAAVAIIGMILGLGGSLFSARLIQGLVHGVSPTDPTSLVVASLVIGLATALATMVPVRRALLADPRSAIQGEGLLDP
jgi:putative ABC transport system permease protein